MRLFRFFSLSLGILSCFVFYQSVLAASVLQFSSQKIEVKEGEKFTLGITALPSEGKNYTVKVNVEFPAEILSVSGWSYGDDWMPLRKSGYDSLDNSAGVLVRTAGYPEGFSSQVLFGKITFVAQKSGTAWVRLTSDSLVLDQNNKNVVGLGAPVQVVVQSQTVFSLPPEITSVDQKPEVVPRDKVLSNGPIQNQDTDQSFFNSQDIITSTNTPTTTSDIVIQPEVPSTPVFEFSEGITHTELRLNQADFKSSSDLVAFSVIDNFGENAVEVVLQYRIQDETGKIYGTKSKKLQVEKQEVTVMDFKDLSLLKGTYVLFVNVLVNGQIVDQKEEIFTVQGKSSISFVFGVSLFLLTTFLVAILLVITKKIRSRTKVPHEIFR